jgi:hypothetical protein
MDLNMPAQREKVTIELKRAIRNINRNLYEWKDKKAGKTNFSISHTEVYSVTRNWIIRCLRSIMDASSVDRIFRGGHLYLQMDEANMCISKISTNSHETYRSYYNDAKTIGDILEKLDYKALRYDPDDYAPDGVTQTGFNSEVFLSFDEISKIKF